MDRRRFLLTSLAGALAAPLAAGAQQAGKIYRIGYLASPTADNTPHLREAFRQGLRELGWVEGQNIVIDFDMRRASTSGCPTSRPSWSASRWIPS